MKTIEEARDRLIQHANDAVRRPGIWGGELTIRILLADLAFIDEADDAWTAEQQQLRDRGSWTEIGVRGAFATIFGGRQQPRTHDETVGSVYADIAHRLGYLHLDHALSPTGYRQLRQQARPWCRAADRTRSDIINTFGEPSIHCGGTSPYWPATLAYTTSRPTDPLICFDTWNEIDHTVVQAEQRAAGRWEPEPILRNVRIRTATFPRDFTYTPTGKTMRQRTDYPLHALRGAPVPR